MRVVGRDVVTARVAEDELTPLLEEREHVAVGVVWEHVRLSGQPVSVLDREARFWVVIACPEHLQVDGVEDRRV